MPSPDATKPAEAGLSCEKQVTACGGGWRRGLPGLCPSGRGQHRGRRAPWLIVPAHHPLELRAPSLRRRPDARAGRVPAERTRALGRHAVEVDAVPARGRIGEVGLEGRASILTPAWLVERAGPDKGSVQQVDQGDDHDDRNQQDAGNYAECAHLVVVAAGQLVRQMRRRTRLLVVSLHAHPVS